MRNQYLEQKPDVEELITSHMELVRQIAWHMHGRVHSSIEIDDLIQIGYFGLVTAAQNYAARRRNICKLCWHPDPWRHCRPSS